jgi:hypothetical protein
MGKVQTPIKSLSGRAVLFGPAKAQSTPTHPSQSKKVSRIVSSSSTQPKKVDGDDDLSITSPSKRPRLTRRSSTPDPPITDDVGQSDINQAITSTTRRGPKLKQPLAKDSDDDLEAAISAKRDPKPRKPLAKGSPIAGNDMDSDLDQDVAIITKQRPKPGPKPKKKALARPRRGRPSLKKRLDDMTAKISDSEIEEIEKPDIFA